MEINFYRAHIREQGKRRMPICVLNLHWAFWGDLPGSPDGEESACGAGDPGLIPESGRSPGEGNGNLLQYSCLENPIDRGVWQGTAHEVARVRYH